jgi:hypothetical protein
VWKKIKKAWEVVGLLPKVIDAVIWLAGIVVPTVVVNSSTLRLWIIGGGVLGGGLGYYSTTQWWAGKGEQTCKLWSKVFLILAVISLIGFTFLLAVLKPDFAILHPNLEAIREFLLRGEFFPNLFAFLLCAAMIWFSVSFVTLLSRRLWSTSL